MGSQLNRLLASRYRISTQLYLCFAVAVGLTVAASLVGWFSFNRVGGVQSRVNEVSVPELAAAFGVAQYGGTLVTAAPSLTVATTRQDFLEVVTNIDQSYAAFEEQIAVLEQVGGESDRVAAIRAYADTLFSNIEAIKGEMSSVFVHAGQREMLQVELANVRSDLDDVLAPGIDDQFFYTLTGYRSLDDSPVPQSEHFSEEEFIHYRRLAEMQADTNIATELLANAFTLSDASQIEPLRERFEATSSRIERNLGTLEGSDFYGMAVSAFNQLFDLGLGEESVFNLFASELAILENQRDLLALNRELSVALVDEVDGLVSASQVNVQDATTASTQAIFAGRVLLIGISSLSVVGTLLVIWLFVGRVLLRRLGLLSEWMRSMARGDLETKAEISGRDEVADMAAALDVFRRHALEVQRLNLVEQLAADLQDKNVELEGVLAELRKAQGQIVMQQKLAALGELTAGVAHEIKNPLNFVNNFSEASGELITELRELLEEEDVELSDEQRSLVADITQDLTDNVERIRSHGQRANRIVHDMLMMGRGSEDWQLTDINGLLDQHAKLAYHSARAANSDFNLDLQFDLDPEMGQIEVIAQDLGRVFLNMVSNACHSVDKKRRLLEERERSGEAFSPTLSLKTHRGENSVEIRIRDNGVGISHDIIEKIFNPFFTTKATDEGTGLGLAISSDIVRRHGGSIRVESEEGEFAEMIVELPLKRPPDVAESGDEEGDGASGAVDNNSDRGIYSIERAVSEQNPADVAEPSDTPDQKTG